MNYRIEKEVLPDGTEVAKVIMEDEKKQVKSNKIKDA